MTGITAEIRNNCGSMVGVGIKKTARSMTVTTFSISLRMTARRSVGWDGCLTYGHCIIVAAGACPGNVRMIKAAVQR